MAEKMYVHSKCCNAHWELCYNDGVWSLECASCGEGPGPGLEISGPPLQDCTCSICGQEGSPTKH